MTLRQPGDASGLVQVVLGSQWGDEGKGKLIDFLAEHVDIVARCQGGNNAGHTVVVGDRSYDFHLIPSGIIWPRCVAVIGNGVVIHLPDLFEELQKVEAKGLLDWQSRLKISDRAHLVFDFHKHVDGMQESERSLDLGQLGTTKKGIGPAYASKANRNGLRMSDLLGDFRLFSDKFSHLVDGYSARFKLLHVNKDEEMERYRQLAEKVRPLVTETVSFIHDQMRQGRRLLIEGANASMLDIDFGTYPFVTSSNCSIGGVCTGLGLPPTMIGHVFGVVKAYTTRVGDGPFPTEQLNDTGKMLQQKGQEFGVTTGRERRCGWLDIPVLKFSHLINGYTALALTKLDVLEDLDEIQIGLEYQLKGQSLSNVPSNVDDLAQVTVKYITLPGWKTKIGQCKHFHELPATAQGYVHAIESYLGVPIRWIGVGPAREQMIVKT